MLPGNQLMASKTKGNLLLLPSEIRHRIYQYIFGWAIIEVFQKDQRNWPFIEAREAYGRVLRVCKQIYQDARPVLAAEILLLLHGQNGKIQDMPMSIKNFYLPLIARIDIMDPDLPGYEFEFRATDLPGLKKLKIANRWAMLERKLDIGNVTYSDTLYRLLLGKSDQFLIQDWLSQPSSTANSWLHNLMITPVADRSYKIELELIVGLIVLRNKGGQRRAEIQIIFDLDTEVILRRNAGFRVDSPSSSTCRHFEKVGDIQAWLGMTGRQGIDSLSVKEMPAWLRS